MKNKIKLLTIVLFFLMAAPAFGLFTSNLYLWKKNPYDYGKCGFCSNYLNFVENQNRINFADYNLATQDGYYYFNLTGHEGSTVTFFGLPKYETRQGFLIVKKNDDRDIVVPDMEAFPPGRWTKVEATEKGQGSYSVFYQPGENFSWNVSSVKWGEWWESSLVPVQNQ